MEPTACLVGQPTGALLFIHGRGDFGCEVRKWLERAGKGELEKRLEAAGIIVEYPDIFEDDNDSAGDQRYQPQVDHAIDKLVDAGIDASRICVGGMSMGGKLSLHTAYGAGKYVGRLGAVACLSGGWPEDRKLEALDSGRFKGENCLKAPPLFMAHGGADIQIPLWFAKKTRTRLLDGGVPIPEDLMMYPQIGHDLCDWEVEDLADFVVKYICCGDCETGPVDESHAGSSTVVGEEVTVLRAPLMMQVWEVVGGADKGGILVRQGASLSSEKYDERLATSALIEECERVGKRLRYLLLSGTGPAQGWVSLEVSGKVLLTKSKKHLTKN